MNNYLKLCSIVFLSLFILKFNFLLIWEKKNVWKLFRSLFLSVFKFSFILTILIFFFFLIFHLKFLIFLIFFVLLLKYNIFLLTLFSDFKITKNFHQKLFKVAPEISQNFSTSHSTDNNAATIDAIRSTAYNFMVGR